MYSERWNYGVVVAIIVMALCVPAHEKGEELEHIRGQIISIEGSSMVVKIGDGKEMSLGLPDNFTVISLTNGSYTGVDFGVYVGAVAVKLDQYSPIVRHSLNLFHTAFEL